MSIITSRESARARKAILGAGALERYDQYMTFASGRRANNHLSMEKLQNDDRRRAAVVDPIRKVVRRYRPNLLIGIPRGAQNLALEVGFAESIAVAELIVIDKKHKVFGYATRTARQLVEGALTIGVIEDATSVRSNEAGVYKSLPEIGKRAIFCATGWARAAAEERISDGMPPLFPVVDEIIPYHLTPEDPLYEFAVLTKLEHHA